MIPAIDQSIAIVKVYGIAKINSQLHYLYDADEDALAS